MFKFIKAHQFEIAMIIMFVGVLGGMLLAACATTKGEEANALCIIFTSVMASLGFGMMTIEE